MSIDSGCADVEVSIAPETLRSSRVAAEVEMTIRPLVVPAVTLLVFKPSILIAPETERAEVGPDSSESRLIAPEVVRAATLS